VQNKTEVFVTSSGKKRQMMSFFVKCGFGFFKVWFWFLQSMFWDF